MNALFIPASQITAAETPFTELCTKRAQTFAAGVLTLQEAVDELQAYAKLTGLIDRIGQDEVQAIMADAFDAVRHQGNDGLDVRVECEIMLRAANLVRQWELADPRDAWRHTGEAPPKATRPQADPPKAYETPEATIDAFWYVVGSGDAGRLASWLSRHPLDAPYLQKLWRVKHAHT